MGAWGRASFAAVGLWILLGSCAGEDFDSGGGGSGGTSADAAVDRQDDAPVCTTADAGAVGDCTDELFCRSCNQVTTGEPSCDECARTHCCAQAVECMADQACARLMACYFKRCKGQTATTCPFEQCADCLQNYGLFALELGPCMFQNCKQPVDHCPQLVW